MIVFCDANSYSQSNADIEPWENLFLQVASNLEEVIQRRLQVLRDLSGDHVGSGRLAESSRLSSFNQKMSRLTLSRFSRSS